MTDPRERCEEIISYYVQRALIANREEYRPALFALACEHAAKAIVFEYDLEPAQWPQLRLH